MVAGAKVCAITTHIKATKIVVNIGVFHGVAGVAGVPPLGLWNFYQPVKELKSAGKMII